MDELIERIIELTRAGRIEWRLTTDAYVGSFGGTELRIYHLKDTGERRHLLWTKVLMVGANTLPFENHWHDLVGEIDEYLFRDDSVGVVDAFRLLSDDGITTEPRRVKDLKQGDVYHGWDGSRYVVLDAPVFIEDHKQFRWRAQSVCGGPPPFSAHEDGDVTLDVEVEP